MVALLRSILSNVPVQVDCLPSTLAFPKLLNRIALLICLEPLIRLMRKI